MRRVHWLEFQAFSRPDRAGAGRARWAEASRDPRFPQAWSAPGWRPSLSPHLSLSLPSRLRSCWRVSRSHFITLTTKPEGPVSEQTPLSVGTAMPANWSRSRSRPWGGHQSLDSKGTDPSTPGPRWLTAGRSISSFHCNLKTRSLLPSPQRKPPKKKAVSKPCFSQ